MPEINEEKINELINEIRGTTSEDKLREGVEAIIKADTKKTEEKAKIDAEKKLLDKIEAAAEKIKNEEKEADDTDEEPPKPPERDKEGKFKKKEPDHPEEPEDKDEETIKKLTEQMEKMAKEIEALKKRKNYRTKPPKGEEVDEVDDFIKQNITKDFEVII